MGLSSLHLSSAMGADWSSHALLDIAPAYLEHLAGTHNRATALTKIVGFYTGESHSPAAPERCFRLADSQLDEMLIPPQSRSTTCRVTNDELWIC